MWYNFYAYTQACVFASGADFICARDDAQYYNHRLLINYVYNRRGTGTFFWECNLVHRTST